MKWCLLLNNVPYFAQFLGEFSKQIVKHGDECIVLVNSLIAYWEYKSYYHEEARFFLKTEWLKNNYQKNIDDFQDLSWEEFFSTFDRQSSFNFFKFDFVNSFEIISQLYQFYDFIFKKEKPDIILHEPPANIFNEMAYYFSHKNTIPYLGLINSRFTNKIDIYNNKYSCSLYRKKFKTISNGQCKISSDKKLFIKTYIKSFLRHEKLPSYITPETSNFHKKKIFRYYCKRLIAVSLVRLKYFVKRKRLHNFDYEDEGILHSTFRAPYNALIRKIRFLFQRNHYMENYNFKNYFLYPLHLQPEASTSGQAKFFSDQLTTIKNIAFSLPFPYKLYVKEHPAALGTRPTRFYKELGKIPNVVLISAFEDVRKLIDSSKGVIALTSTVGMEAALAGVPVYLLGDVFYSYHPLCRKVTNFCDLRNKVRVDLKNKSNFSDIKHININFGLSYFLNTIEGNLLNTSKNNYQAIYMNIKNNFLQSITGSDSDEK